MENKEIEEGANSYDFYVKNFPFIKYLIDEKYIERTDKILLVIFYDHELYKKYLEKKDDDFMQLLIDKFNDCETYNNEQYGVFIICGDLRETIDLVINDVFSEKKGLKKNELESIGVINGNKSNHNFYISLLQIYFFDSTGTMNFKFKEIKNEFSNENENNI